MRLLKVADVKKWNRIMDEIETASLTRKKAILSRMLKSMYRTFDPEDPYATTLIETTEQELMSVMQQMNASRQKIAR